MASVHAQQRSKTSRQAPTGENPVAGHLGVHRLVHVAFQIFVHSNRPPGLKLASSVDTGTVESDGRHPAIPKAPAEHPVTVGERRYCLLGVGLQFFVHVHRLKGLLLSCRMWCRTYINHR